MRAYPLYNHLLKIFGYSVIFISITVIVISSYDERSDKAEQSQFYQEDHDLLVWSNLIFSVVAAVSMSNVRLNKWKYYIPNILVAITAEFLSITSGIFHKSFGHGITGRLDVGSILPFCISMAYLICDEIAKTNKFKKNFNINHDSTLSDAVNLKTYDTRLYGKYWFVPHIIIIIINIAVFTIYVLDVIHIPWKTIELIFAITLIFLGVIGIFAVFYLTWAWDTKGPAEFHRKVHVLLFTVGIIILIIICFIGLPNNKTYHSSLAHLIPGEISIVVLFFMRSPNRSINIYIKEHIM